MLFGWLWIFWEDHVKIAFTANPHVRLSINAVKLKWKERESSREIYILERNGSFFACSDVRIGTVYCRMVVVLCVKGPIRPSLSGGTAFIKSFSLYFITFLCFQIECELVDKLDILVQENKADENYKQLFDTMWVYIKRNSILSRKLFCHYIQDPRNLKSLATRSFF